MRHPHQMPPFRRASAALPAETVEVVGRFTSETVPLLHIPAQRTAILLRDTGYICSKGLTHIAHRDMLCDGASIPRFLWRAIGAPYADIILMAAAIHDHYCHKAMILPPGSPGRIALRLEADRLFKEMTATVGAPRVRVYLLYRGVRTGALYGKRKPAYPCYICDTEAFYTHHKVPHRHLTEARTFHQHPKQPTAKQVRPDPRGGASVHS